MTQNGTKIDYIRIGLASPACIKKWGTRRLPNGTKIGKIVTSKTVDYKTFQPEPGGLFSEKIFGPINNFECFCGQKIVNSKWRTKTIVCPDCNVEFTKSQVRRYRMGYIKLASPVTHIWYLKGRPRYLSLLLDSTEKFIKKRKQKKVIESIVYSSETIHLLVRKYVKNTKIQVPDLSSENNEISTNTISGFKPFYNVKNNTENFLIYEYYFYKLKNKLDKSSIFKTQLTPLFYNLSYLNAMKFYFLERSKLSLPNLNFIQVLNKKLKDENFSTENRKGVTKLSPKKIFLNKAANTILEHSSTKTSLRLALVLKSSVNKQIKTNKVFTSTRLKFGKKKKKKKHGLPKANHGSSNFLQPPIYPYYPISFHYLIFSGNSSELKLKKDLNVLTEYFTPDQSKLDSKISIYSYRFLHKLIIKNKSEYQYKQFFLTGTKAIHHLLKTLDIQSSCKKLKPEIKALDDLIEPLKRQGFLTKDEKKQLRRFVKWRLYNVRCVKILSHFQQNSSKLRLEWMVLSVLPVLPPDLRPLIKVGSHDRPFASDLIPLYQSILNRNKRISTYQLNNYPVDSNDVFYRFNLRLLQQAVDALIENGKGGTPVASNMNGSPYKSLSAILKGKKGRFRNNLLGKRVDYSGRSVIVVAPELKLHECGLPKQMAIELFQPFIIRELRKKFNKPINIAKILIHKQDPIIWKILQKILKAYPVLLNRAPTLHRLGIQAFQAKLVDGQAILLHPLVCPAFNADFDGDQMAVHVPLSCQARAEAWRLMWSRNNLLSPATGQPIIVPTQDMILGCYYLTTTTLPSVNLSGQNFNSFHNSSSKSRELEIFCYFSNLNEVLIAFYQKKILLHSFIWVRCINLLQIENFYGKPFEIRLDCSGNSVEIYSQYWRNLDTQYHQISQFIRTTAGRVLLNKIILENGAFVVDKFKRSLNLFTTLQT